MAEWDIWWNGIYFLSYVRFRRRNLMCFVCFCILTSVTKLIDGNMKWNRTSELTCYWHSNQLACDALVKICIRQHRGQASCNIHHSKINTCELCLSQQTEWSSVSFLASLQDINLCIRFGTCSPWGVQCDKLTHLHFTIKVSCTLSLIRLFFLRKKKLLIPH